MTKKKIEWTCGHKEPAPPVKDEFGYYLTTELKKCPKCGLGVPKEKEKPKESRIRLTNEETAIIIIGLKALKIPDALQRPNKIKAALTRRLETGTRGDHKGSWNLRLT